MVRRLHLNGHVIAIRGLFRQRYVLETISVLAVAFFLAIVTPRMMLTDLGWVVQAQASAHATVLGLLATVTAVFLYMTLQWSMTQVASQTQSADTVRKYYEGAGWASLLFALFSFGIAAFNCAMLAGFKSTVGTSTLRPFAIMIYIYALYLWGIFLAAMGGMYTARLFGFGVADFLSNRVVLQLIGVVGLVVLHSNASLVFSINRVPNHDWLLYFCIVVLVMFDPLWTRIIKVSRYFDSGLKLRRLLIWICLAAAAVPLFVCAVSFWFNRPSWLNDATNQEGVSRWMTVWLIGLYVTISLPISILVNIYRKSSVTPSSPQEHKADSAT